jgi:hypothetical protein
MNLACGVTIWGGDNSAGAYSKRRKKRFADTVIYSFGDLITFSIPGIRYHKCH